MEGILNLGYNQLLNYFEMFFFCLKIAQLSFK